MNTPFQPDPAQRVPEEAALIDPEAYDASEQKFAASLEDSASGSLSDHSIAGKDQANAPGAGDQDPNIVSSALTTAGAASTADMPPASNPEAWRQEVADKLTRYRARRHPREPRYPSLQLKFEPTDPAWSSVSEASSHLILNRSPAAAQVAHDGWPADTPLFEVPAENPTAETTARVIPFRRSGSAPPKPLEELAEPMQLFPRILEVPEVAPPPPALGGILIEPVDEEPAPKRPGIDLPLQTSAISRRFLAASVDGMFVAAGLGLFGYIFFRITGAIPPFRQFAEMGALVLGILWAGYQYLLLTYAGSTPGLKLARLRLSRFDGVAVAGRARRWRALASILSAISLGLGYAWCMIDEDQLCWHDRITHTHLAPKR